MFNINCIDFVQLLFPSCLEGINLENDVIVIPFVGEALLPIEVEEHVEVVELEDEEEIFEFFDAADMEVGANVEVMDGDAPEIAVVDKYDEIDEILRVAEMEYAANVEVAPEADEVVVHEEVVPAAPQGLAFVCLDVITGVVYDLRNGCDCGSAVCQQRFEHDINVWEQQVENGNPGDVVELPDYIVAEPRISEAPPVMYVPTQKITWNVEENYVDYDDNALCLCGDFYCRMKFQLNPSVDLSRVYTSECCNKTEEDRKYNQKMLKEHDDMDKEKTRRYIAILEEESKLNREDLPYPERSIPWTLFAGIPFYMMTNEQLQSSRRELNELIESAEFRANFQWLQANQCKTPGNEARTELSLYHFLALIAERTEDKIRHYELLLAIVTHVQVFRR